MVDHTSLRAEGSPWHTGDKTINFSFLGSEIPTYHQQIHLDASRGGDGDSGTTDAFELSPADGDSPASLIGKTENPAFNDAQKAATYAAVSYWNDVANVNLIEGASGTTAPTTVIPGNGNLVTGLGGTSGCGEHSNSFDSFVTYDSELVNSVFEDGINFYGSIYNEIFASGGVIGFGEFFSTFAVDPSRIHPVTDAQSPGIFPFLSFLGNEPSAINSSARAALHYADFDTTNDVITVTWPNVGFKDAGELRDDPDQALNSFQLQLYDRGNGDFDFVFRYDDINWNARLGTLDNDGNGLSDDAARAGWTAGDQTNFGEIPGSGDSASTLHFDVTPGNTGVAGLWVFEVRGGVVNGTTSSNAGLGDIVFGAFNGRSVDGTNSTLATIGSAGRPYDNPAGFAQYQDGLGTVGDGGDVWINNNSIETTNPQEGNFGWITIVHEIGHALGLSHPDNQPDNASLPNNSEQYTVMSYVSHPNLSNDEAAAPPSNSSDYAHPITPMLFDIQAIQNMYGANMSTRTGDTTYFGPEPGSVFAMDDNDKKILGIWDAGGIDTFDASNQTSSSRIDLRPGEYSTIGAIQNNVVIASGKTKDGEDIERAETAWIENAIGGSEGDVLIGNILGNVFQGNGGGDVIEGGGGVDVSRYTEAYSNFEISGNLQSNVSVTDKTTNATDSLDSVERLEFADGFVYFDVNGVSGQAYRIYKAAFNRTPDNDGLKFWIDNKV